MKKLAGVLVLVVIAWGPVAWAQTEPGNAPGPAPTHLRHDGSNTPAEVNAALERLAAAFAVALEDGELRTVLREALESPADVPLRSLLGDDSGRGSLLATKLTDGYRRAGAGGGDALDLDTAIDGLASALATVPLVDLSMPIHFDTWDPASQIPLVSFVEEGIADEARTTVKLFDSTGAAMVRGVHEIAGFDFPVLVLEYHDAGELARVGNPGRRQPTLAPRSGLTRKVGPSCTTYNTYYSYPLFSQAAVYDIHESSLNGPEGYGYFTAAGSEKTGNLPSSLGGRSGWATNVWASNFQGEVPVYSTRVQWEWVADGWWEYALRTYPAPYCRQTVSSPSSFSVASYTVKEDDEWPNGDDYVGKVKIDHRYCKSEVFDQGYSSGWTGAHLTPQVDDIKDVRYELYCYKTTSYTCSLICNSWGDKVSCSGSGTCSGCQAGYDWVECNGVRHYCSELWE